MSIERTLTVEMFEVGVGTSKPETLTHNTDFIGYPTRVMAADLCAEACTWCEGLALRLGRMGHVPEVPKPETQELTDADVGSVNEILP